MKIKNTIKILFTFTVFVSCLVNAADTCLGDMPDSLKYKVGSGHLYDLVNRNIKESRDVQTSLNKSMQTRIPVAIYLKTRPNVNQLEQLTSRGIVVLKDSWTGPVGTHPLGFILALLPTDQFLPILQQPFVQRLDAADMTFTAQNNTAAVWVEAGTYWQNSYDGSGSADGSSVRVAVLDASLDLSHPDLPTPIVQKDYSNAPNYDNDITTTVSGHGTHVTGTILGRGTQSLYNIANGGGPYKGMAPGAELIFLKIGNDDDASASTLAMYYALQDAVTQYDADVVNLSYGGWDAYHDGSHILAQKIDELVSTYDVPIIVAAGNYGNDDLHYSTTVPANSESEFIRVDANVPAENYLKLMFNTIWYDGPNENRSLELLYYDSSQNQITLNIESNPQTQSTKGTEHQISYLNEYLPEGNHIYYLKVVNHSSFDQKVHIYEDYGKGGVTFANADPQYTVTNPGCADYAFTVGAMKPRDEFMNYLGNTYTTSNTGDLCDFSGRGPRVDEIQKPDIIAPGYWVVSIRDHIAASAPSNNWIDNDGQDFGDSNDADYIIMSGTSMATPVVTGSAALILDENPSYSAQQVYSALTEYADVEEGIVIPDASWGYGILDLDEDDTSYDPVSVDLTSFTAERQQNGIRIQWSADNLVKHAGFNILKSNKKQFGYKQLNSLLITVKPGHSGTQYYSFWDETETGGMLYYKLEEIGLDGSKSYYGPVIVNNDMTIVDESRTGMFKYQLKTNYPNPFNASTTVSFECAHKGPVQLLIYNMQGQLIRTLLDQSMEAGEHTVSWNGKNDFGIDQSSGVYFIRILANQYTDQHKMTLVR